MEIIEFLMTSKEFCENYKNGCSCEACPATYLKQPKNHFCHDDIGEDFDMAPIIRLNYAPIKTYVSHLETWVKNGKPKAVFKPKQRKEDTESYGLVDMHEELSKKIENAAHFKAGC